MQDMLKKIIEIDEQARHIKEKAEREKANTESEIADIRKEIYDDYLSRAKIRVEKNIEADRATAEKDWESTQKLHAAALSALQTDYQQNHDKWSDEIVSRVIGQ